MAAKSETPSRSSRRCGARFGRSAPPEQHFVSIDCKNSTLGDEGYRLVGKCFRLQAAKFLECDLNDDRMQYLAGLRNLTSLTISDTPEVTDAGIKKIAGLRELTSVLLRGTHVGDLGLPSIVKLPDLRVLDLSRTQVTDDGMSALRAPAHLDLAAHHGYGGHGRGRGQAGRLVEFTEPHPEGKQGDRQGKGAVAGDVSRAEN